MQVGLLRNVSLIIKQSTIASFLKGFSRHEASYFDKKSYYKASYCAQLSPRKKLTCSTQFSPRKKPIPCRVLHKPCEPNQVRISRLKYLISIGHRKLEIWYISYMYSKKIISICYHISECATYVIFRSNISQLSFITGVFKMFTTWQQMLFSRPSQNFAKLHPYFCYI